MALAEPKKPKQRKAKEPSTKDGTAPISSELGRRLYEYMLRTWLFEERVLTLYRQGGLFGGLYTGSGNEAVSVGSGMALEPEDVVAPSHRGIGVHFVRGENFRDMMLQLMARADGGTKGRDNAAHQCSLERGILGNISHMGAWCPLAAGAALKFSLNNEKRVGLSYIGDGSTSLGIFHELLNLTAVLELPFVLIIENNQWAYSTPSHLQYRCERLSDRASGYGIYGATIDGTDVETVYTTVKEALEQAREHRRPALIEAVTMRLRGHSAADEGEYVPKDALIEWNAKQPVESYGRVLAERGWMSVEEQRQLTERISAELEEAVAAAQSRPVPEPHTALEGVYAQTHSGKNQPGKNQSGISSFDSAPITYIDAIRLAMIDELKSDDTAFIIGEDIGRFGGAFKATKGLLDEFGRGRIIDTPIAENGFVGLAIGAAIWGMRPIVEIQFADFVTEAFTQIVYNAAKMYYRTGVAVPMVIRLPVGGGMGAGPFHSANPEAWFCHIPGLKVAAPSTPSDAYALLRAAAADPNPVIFLEHKFLYRRVKETLRQDSVDFTLGRARVARAGTDATVVSYGAMVHHALEAAETLAAEGVEIEVVDLRTLLPWDKQSVLESAKKTSRVMVLHEAPLTGGFGGEIAATIGQQAFEYLDAPVMRLASHDIPVPFAPTLEQFYMPGVGVIVDKLRFLLKY